MKILHTSDLHLGHTLYGYSRAEEQDAVLRQIVQMVAAHRPDAVVISGDIYDLSQPAADPSRRFQTFLLAMKEVLPTLVVVCTAGNHDSASRHEVFREPWLLHQVHLIGQVRSDFDPQDFVIPIPGKGYIVAAPFVHERTMPSGFYAQLLAAVPVDGLPVVLMAHTALLGCDFAGHHHATETLVGNIEAVDCGDLGKGYDYLALGHIHRPQFVRNTGGRARYCGTPLPIHFDEVYAQLKGEPYQHSVSLVEIGERGAYPVVTPLEVVNPKPLVTIPARETYATWEEVEQLLQQFQPTKPSYIRLNILAKDALPPLVKERVVQILAEKECPCMLCCIQMQREAAADAAQKRTLSVQALRQIAPLELAKRYAQESGKVFDEVLIALFKEAESEFNAPNHED